MAPVVLDGRVLFRVAASGNYSASDRAQLIGSMLRRQIAGAQPAPLEVATRDRMATIRLGKQHLLSIMDGDLLPGTTAEEQAERWRQSIGAALQQARAERTPAYMRRAILRCLAILLAAAALHWLSRRAARRLPHRAAWSNEARSASVSWHSWLHLLLGLSRVALWAAMLPVLAEQFPLTRHLRFQLFGILYDTLSVSIFSMNGRRYSALDALTLIALVAALWLTTSVLTRWLKSRLLRATHADRGALEPVAVLLQYGLAFLGLIVVLQTWGLDLSSLTIPASVLGVGIGFGLQNIANNFISGLILAFERPIQVGDFVHVGDLAGTVERIGTRSTEIRTLDYLTIIMPNARFLEGEVVNWSHGDPLSRLHLPVGVAYGSDIHHVRAALLEAARTHPEVLADPRPEVRFEGFGESALSFELLVWTRDPRAQSHIKSDLYYRIEENLRRHGVEIPFPQRTLHLPAQIEALIGAWRGEPAAREVALYYPNGDRVRAPSRMPSPTGGDGRAVAPLAALDVEELVARMRAPGGLDIRDRRHRLTTYARCFVGAAAVEWLMGHEDLSREEAVRVGQALVERSVIHHVLDEHPFRDGPYFYRFYADERPVVAPPEAPMPRDAETSAAGTASNRVP
jgi:potassium efflux system protein